MEPVRISCKTRPFWPALLMFVVTLLLLALAGCEHGQPQSPRKSAPTSGNAVVSAMHSAAEAAVTPLDAPGAQEYAGDAACAPCHADIGRKFAGTAHANTLRRVDARSFGALFRSNQVLQDHVIGYTYRPGIKGDRCVLRCKGEAGQIETVADLAVGRGHSGVTFIGNVGGDDWATLRLSYYTTRKAWRFSPGQAPGDPWQPAIGQRLTPDAVVACLSCHVTYLRQTGGRLNINASHLGIGCERCHGPARRHAETARLAITGKTVPIAPPGNALHKEPARIEALCGPCHSATETPTHAGDVGSIREIERFETTALESSRCYRESRGLTCLTCHDPHTDVPQNGAKVDSDSNRACLRCHSRSIPPAADPGAAYGPGHPCPVNPKTECVQCHMPAKQFPDVPSLPFHTHWIKAGRGGTRDGAPQHTAAPL